MDMTWVTDQIALGGGIWNDENMEELVRHGTLLVTMGCGDACPYVPGLKKLDWPLTDPKGQPLDEVRKIRDEIRERVANLATERAWL